MSDSGMPSDDSQTGGGSIGAEKTDVSEGHVVCSRSDHGLAAPGNPDKSPPSTAREFEHALRELGYSKRQAREIASHGFKVMAPDAEAAEDMSELAALLERNFEILERIERHKP